MVFCFREQPLPDAGEENACQSKNDARRKQRKDARKKNFEVLGRALNERNHSGDPEGPHSHALPPHPGWSISGFGLRMRVAVTTFRFHAKQPGPAVLLAKMQQRPTYQGHHHPDGWMMKAWRMRKITHPALARAPA